MEIETFSRLRNVPLFRAGTHNGLTFTDADLDEMAQASTEAQEYVRKSIETGVYDGNEHIDLRGKPIPSYLNLAHQQFLPDTMKNLTRDVVVSFGTQIIDGVKWLTGTFENVSQELAEFIQHRFPYRSIELLPVINVNGKQLQKVIRSIGFLPADIPAAVTGQSPELAVEFSAAGGAGIITLFSQYEPTTHTEGVSNMAEKKTDTAATPVTPDPVTPSPVDSPKAAKAISPAEFQAVIERQKDQEAKLKEQEAQIAEFRAQAEAEKSEKMKMQEQLTAVQQDKEAQALDMYCEKLIHEFQASPAFIALVRPHLEQANANIVIEFAEDKKATQRQGLQELFKSILEKRDSLTVPIGEFAKADHAPPDTQKMGREEKQQARIAEFADAAKARVQNPNDNKEVWLKAREMAIDAYPNEF